MSVFCSIAISSSVLAMNFKFAPLGKNNQVEISISTGFAGGTVRGVFRGVEGEVYFYANRPSATQGTVRLDARALYFGHHRVTSDAPSNEWLNANKFPEIFFNLEGLKEPVWAGNELRAVAYGSLRIKNHANPFSIPVSIKYLRAARRKLDGVRGDVLVLRGESSLSRSQFGINPGSMFDSVMDRVTVKIKLVGGSSKVRPFFTLLLVWPIVQGF